MANMQDQAVTLLANARSSGIKLSSALYDVLKTRLLDGEYPGGERIVVEHIRNEFHVSKQPVMEALRRLSADHLVRIIPQSGVEVISYSPREVEDFFLIFSKVEAELAAVAADRRTSDQLLTLNSALSSADELTLYEDRNRRARAYRIRNRAFHSVIHEMSNSRIMKETSQRMWDMSDFLISTAGGQDPLAEALDDRQSDHTDIYRAIRDRDRDSARFIMSQHILDTVSLIDVRPGRADVATQSALDGTSMFQFETLKPALGLGSE